MPLKQMGNQILLLEWCGMEEQKVQDEEERSKGKVEDKGTEQIIHNAPTF